MRSISLALIAAALSVVAASPISERAAPPAIYQKQGQLRVLGVGASNKSYNETASFNGGGTLALGHSNVPFSVQVVSQTNNYQHAIGYIHQSAVSCVTANKASGRTSFKLEPCADAATAEQNPEDLRKRQYFQLTPGGDTINLVLGNPDQGIASRPNVRIVGGNEVHTTPDNTDHNYQLYLQ